MTERATPGEPAGGDDTREPAAERQAPDVEPPAGGEAPGERAPWRAIMSFTGLAFLLGWAVALPLWLGQAANPVVAPLIAYGLMFTPAVAVVIVWFATKTPRRSFWRFVGAWPLRPAGRTVWFCVIGLFGPILLVIAGLALSAAFGWIQLDLKNLSGFAAQLEAAGADTSTIPLHMVVLIQLVSIPFAAVIPNSILAFGEELAWRGWLTSALRPWGVWRPLLLIGVIWGLWHAPIILLGQNYQRTDVTGVLLMVAFCVCWGVLLGWLRMRSGSLWPAVLAHGSMNAVAGLAMVLYAAGTTFDFALIAPTGVAMWIVLAVVVGLLAACGQFRAAKFPGFAGTDMNRG